MEAVLEIAIASASGIAKIKRRSCGLSCRRRAATSSQSEGWVEIVQISVGSIAAIRSVGSADCEGQAAVQKGPRNGREVTLLTFWGLQK